MALGAPSNQRAHRSAVSNGTRLFAVEGLDGRTQTARRFRDLVETIGDDLGGTDHISEGQKQLTRRAAMLSIMAEAMEADAVRNLPFDGEAYGILCDRLGRCLQRLGIERKAPDDRTVFRIIGGLPPPPMQTQSNGSLSLPEKESVG